MQPYSPWQSPPNTGTLEMGDLASFEINDIEEPEAEAEGRKETMVAALAAINQQSIVINKLLDMLSSKKGN